MKLYFYKNKVNYKEYSVWLIERLLADYLVNDPNDADYTLVSMCDIDEVGDCIKAKGIGLPVIAGGMISDYPILNEIADYVWHGEIYGFKANLDNGLSVLDMPSISHKDNRHLVVDQRIDWSSNPIVRVGKRAMYYYVSKGCPAKCKYCLIGNARDYQFVPRNYYNKALQVAGKNLMPIAAYNPYGVPAKANIGETMLRDYVDGNVGAGAQLIRSGVEFVTHDLSRALAKGVTIDMVNEAIQRAGKEGTKLILYYIAGLESQEAMEDYVNRLSMDYRTTPSITFVYTYLDPQPYTPLHDYDLHRKITGIDSKRLYHIAVQRNKRVRSMPLAKPAKSTLRTLLGRAISYDDYKFIDRIKKKSHEEMIAECARHAPHLLGDARLEEIKSRSRKRTAPDYWDSVMYINPNEEIS